MLFTRHLAAIATVLTLLTLNCLASPALRMLGIKYISI